MMALAKSSEFSKYQSKQGQFPVLEESMAESEVQCLNCRRDLSRILHRNVMTTISGFVSMRMGGPQVPAPLEV